MSSVTPSPMRSYRTGKRILCLKSSNVLQFLSSCKIWRNSLIAKSFKSSTVRLPLSNRSCLSFGVKSFWMTSGAERKSIKQEMREFVVSPRSYNSISIVTEKCGRKQSTNGTTDCHPNRTTNQTANTSSDCRNYCTQQTFPDIRFQTIHSSHFVSEKICSFFLIRECEKNANLFTEHYLVKIKMCLTKEAIKSEMSKHSNIAQWTQNKNSKQHNANVNGMRTGMRKIEFSSKMERKKRWPDVLLRINLTFDAVSFTLLFLEASSLLWNNK